MVLLKNEEQTFDRHIFLDSFLKKKEDGCILYSEKGQKFNIHKEILYQTKFMRNILQSASNSCCKSIEIFCPCSDEDLGLFYPMVYRYFHFFHS